jgi:hypothetical protein
MKKPKLQKYIRDSIEDRFEDSSSVGEHIKTIFAHIDDLGHFIQVQQALLDWASSCANISGRKLKQKSRQIEKSIERYEKQAMEFAHRALRGEFDDYPGYKEAEKLESMDQDDL